MSRHLPLYKIEWNGFASWVDNDSHLDLKVREVLSRVFVPTITVETKPDELDSLGDEIERADGHTS